MRGAICNDPIDTIDISNTLPRQADSNGLVKVKLKCRLEYKGHVYFESVRPYVINQLLQYMKLNNELFSDIEIDISHIPSSLIDMINVDHEIPVEVDRSDQDCDLSFQTDNDSFKEVHNTRVESQENPLDVYRIAANETALVNNSHFGHEFTTRAPEEGNMP